MAKTTRVGLYLGANSVAAAVIQGRDVISLSNYELSAIDKGRAESLNDDIRWEALINKVLRDTKTEAQDVYVSLSDKDFIFRSLEMPLMKKSEIESAIVFEIEKYIPFKMDELGWAYEYVKSTKEKKNIISFVGIRDSNLRKNQDILSRLKIKVSAIEPSCISLLRAIKLSDKFPKIRDFAVLDFTKSEADLTFFQYDLPIFNRYLTIPKEGDSIDLQKFIEAVNLSFQYFKREFKFYNLEKFIVVDDGSNSQLLTSLKSGLQLDIEAISPQDLTGRNNASVESIKALGVVSRQHYRRIFNPVFKLAAISGEEESSDVPIDIPSLRVGLMIALVSIGTIGAVLLSLFFQNQIVFKKNSLKKKERNIIVPDELKNLSWIKRKESMLKKEKRVKALKKVKDSYTGISELYNRMGQRMILPDGIWFKDMNVSFRNKRYVGMITGYAFRNNDYEESLAVDELVSKLNSDFLYINISSKAMISTSSKKKIRGFDVTYFTIKIN